MLKENLKIIIVYGFLGSGKTTLILKVARAIVASGKRVAVVVNEAGKVPIDGKLISVAGLPVKEIFSGCICCSITGDFINTLRTLIEEGSLAYIIVEPSGIADAPRLFDAIKKHVMGSDKKVLILDGARLPLLLKAVGPLIKNQINSADIILLNKMDAVNEEQKSELDELLKTLPHNSPLYPISTKKRIPRFLLNEVL